MAVVQISRIQLRRGKEQEGTGIPQLASGELAWAIDTQRLYIGNGSVSEGAPAVGNTRILTSADTTTLLDVLNYSYKLEDPVIQTGEDPNYPTVRTVQERLEDYVSSADYGIVSDAEDQYEKIQRVIDNLFLEKAIAGSPSRVVLTFAPGTYNFSQTVYLPSYVRIEGAGKQRTIFNHSGTGPAFEFINDTSTTTLRKTVVGITQNTQAKFCYLKGFTLNTQGTAATAFKMYSVRDSVFEDIELTGSYLDEEVTYTNIGIHLDALSTLVTCQRNSFKNITVDGFKELIYAKKDIIDNQFLNCNFINARQGFVLGVGANGIATGEEYGPRRNLIKNSRFERIEREAIIVGRGYGNRSEANSFVNVGNDYAGILNGQSPIIKFDVEGNTSVQDHFDRTNPVDDINLAVDSFDVKYYKEVSGKVHVEELETRTVFLNENITSFTDLIRLPFDTNSGFEVSYTIRSRSSQQMRRGKLTIAINSSNNEIQLTDEYDYAGTDETSDNIKFNAIEGSGYGVTGSLIIQYKNFNTGGTGSDMRYTYRSIS